MEVYLSIEGKKALVAEILTEATSKFSLRNTKNIITDYRAELARVQTILKKTEKRKGWIRKRTIQEIEEVILEERIVAVQEQHSKLLFTDRDWVDIEVKSFSPAYDDVAIFIASELNKFSSNVQVILNDKEKVEELRNPSKR